MTVFLSSIHGSRWLLADYFVSTREQVYAILSSLIIKQRRSKRMDLIARRYYSVLLTMRPQSLSAIGQYTFPVPIEATCHTRIAEQFPASACMTPMLFFSPRILFDVSSASRKFGSSRPGLHPGSNRTRFLCSMNAANANPAMSTGYFRPSSQFDSIPTIFPDASSTSQRWYTPTPVNPVGTSPTLSTARNSLKRRTSYALSSSAK
mmetsp:Transcript_23367/g.61948  ORF Transcript_23367/g.61948 Transcript_23367/m.61948 type:complete len:206 (-) Transcript_23367:26-643(-)